MDEKRYLQTLRDEVKNRRINKILVIPRDRIGDCISDTPLFSILRKHFPDATISALMTSYIKNLATNNPHLNKVYIYHRMKRLKMGYLLQYVPLFYRGLFHNLIEKLNSERFDLIISLMRPIRELRYLYKHVYHRFLLNRETIADYLADHGVTKQTPVYQKNLFFLRAMGIGAQRARGELFWSDDDKSFIDDLFVSLSLKETDLTIVAHPGCAKSKKIKSLKEAKKVWPVENYPKIFKMMIKNYNAKILLTGVQPEELEVNREIKARVGKSVYVVSDTTINQFAYLLSKCRLMLSNDTGGLHVAAAVGIPIVALFGPTSIEQNSPLVAKGFMHVITSNMSCSPCDLEPSCTENICMQKISVDEVFQAITNQLMTHYKIFT
jgi:heptosyltransferase-2